MRIAVVILAGGEGRRIGGDKPMRLLAGMSLLDRALLQARHWSNLVGVSVRHDGQSGAADAEIVRDDPAIEGPLAGLAAALRFARDEGCDAVLTIAADMPFLPQDLAERFERAVGEERVAIARSGGHLHPVCGFWLTEAFDFVPDYLDTGRRSLKGFAERIGFVAVDWPDEPSDPFFNINNPADLAVAERMLSA